MREPTGDERLLRRREGYILELVLNRPQRLNAIDDPMLADLGEAIATAESDPAVRSVFIRGAGRSFCAGADLDCVKAHLAGGTFDVFLERWHEVFDAVAKCSKPVVAAVHGVVFAGGLELVEVCDIVIAAASTEFADRHATLGLFPGGGSTQRLPRIIGARAARWLLLSGESLSAHDVLGIGLATRVVEDSDLLTAGMAAAELLATRSSAASRQIKKALDLGRDLALTDALELERQLAVEHMLGFDAREGLEAFEQRREPHFEGMRP